MTDYAIETRGLTKSFKGHCVVDSLDLMVPRGSVFGFLGPNGSGKTTTVRMLLGLAFPSSGSVSLLGSEMPRASISVLPHVGAMIEGPAFYPFLTGRQNLERFDVVSRSHLKNAKPADVGRALDLVGLSHAAGKKYRAYSLGMRQRLSLAGALMHERQLLVLDEPTNGLDPQGTREVRSLIRRLNDDGTTVFISSHLLGEIDQLCSHAVVLSAGKTVAQGPIEELRKAQKTVMRVETPDATKAVQELVGLAGVTSVTIDERRSGDDILVVQLEDSFAPEELAVVLVRADVRIRSMVNEKPSLEDAFVALTGEGFDVAE